MMSRSVDGMGKALCLAVYFQKENIMKKDNLVFFYITNDPSVALVAEKYGVDRIWIDLEVLGKEERQRKMDTVKSHHSISDIALIKPLLCKAQLMVRINPCHEFSQTEIDEVIRAGCDIIMLPYWKTVDEVRNFTNAVARRCKTTLLLETKEAVDCVDDVLQQGGFDEIHIGLNDLHLSYGLTFMFELLSNGCVESLCRKFKSFHIPYGFGGIAGLGEGLLPAEKIIMEHYRLGSSRAILSRSFCNYEKIGDLTSIERVFRDNMKQLREYEELLPMMPDSSFIQNKAVVEQIVDKIVRKRKLDLLHQAEEEK